MKLVIVILLSAGCAGDAATPDSGRMDGAIARDAATPDGGARLDAPRPDAPTPPDGPICGSAACSDDDPCTIDCIERGTCTSTPTPAAGPDGDGASCEDDCDDRSGDVFPGATDVCNGRDDDCDGELDEDATVRMDWSVDCDGDGYGAAPVPSCTEPLERPPCGGPWSLASALDPGDCNDASSSVHPGQDAFFTGPIAGASAESDFDYDCDGSEEPQYPVESKVVCATDSSGRCIGSITNYVSPTGTFVCGSRFDTSGAEVDLVECSGASCPGITHGVVVACH